MEEPLFTTGKSEPSEYGYGLAYRLARKQLAETDDIDQLCLRAGASYQVIDSQRVITLEYLNQSYQVTLPDADISLIGSEQEVLLRDKILILHYLTEAKGTPLSHKVITYKELPEEFSYFRTFYARTIKPLATHFGHEPHRLLEMAEKLGGSKADYGDLSVTIYPFRRVPITLVIWQGDEEFPPEGNILFDTTIRDYLPAEDIIVLSEILVWKLVRLLKETPHP